MKLKLDPHIHSIYSGDSKTKPNDILKKSKEARLDIIAISDHNTIKGSQIAIKESKKFKDILVIPSIEISTEKGHILGFGVEEIISKGLSPEETIDKIHDANGLAIVPHPYCFYRNGLFCNCDPYKLDIDGIEVKNARFIIGYSNFKSKNLAIKKNLPEIGASDAHFIEFIGDCFTEINCEMNIDSVIKSIKQKKTKATGKGTSNIQLFNYLINKHIKKSY